MPSRRVNRRELLTATAAAGAAVAVGARPARSLAGETATVDFSALAAGDGWPGWRCVGVANLIRREGAGLLEAASDVFPSDPRPVAFAVDRRFRDGEVEATVASAGAGTGVVVRRVAHRRYYAAIFDDAQGALVIIRRSPTDAIELARLATGAIAAPFRLALSAEGRRPTRLVATLTPQVGAPLRLAVDDATPQLARAGDPGVLATAITLFPNQGPPPLPALGNLHLLPYGVQEGAVVIESPAGQQLIELIRERSTAEFTQIVARTDERTRPTTPSVIAATTGAPTPGGARLRVATDVPARVEILLSRDRRFSEPRKLPRRRTGPFQATTVTAKDLGGPRRIYWRARVERRGRRRLGPVRSFRTLPASGSHERARIAIASCASQFGPIFDELAARRPDAFVWQGDLNYPDTAGPLAQSNAGYAGIWRDFLSNPRMHAILARTAFAAQRDDHDYGVQDANSTNLQPWGLAPWEALVEKRTHYRFSAGLADIWVLDQRRHKSDPKLPDTADKTLLGPAQRRWLLRTLAASPAPFKVICSPCTLAPLRANARDGSWAGGFTAERDLLLEQISERVSGQTLFVTGDTHWSLVYEGEGLFEARPCPLGIPVPNDTTIADPRAAETARAVPGVLYADDQLGHFATVEVRGRGASAQLELKLVREDGSEGFARSFEQPHPRHNHR